MKPRPITIADVPVLVTLLNEATPETPVDEDEVRSWFSNPNHDIAGNFRLFDGPAGQVTGDVVGGVFGWAE